MHQGHNIPWQLITGTSNFVQRGQQIPCHDQEFLDSIVDG
jgi:hypothetical protein